MVPAPPETKIEDLALAAGELLVAVDGERARTIQGASFDSRTVQQGELFFCVRGARADGHLFAQAAVDRGAAALCVERPVQTEPVVPQVLVSEVRRAMPQMGAAVYGRPGDSLLLLGVTGTNGKTTSAFLIDSILRADGRETGLIGTIETRIAGDRRPGVRTTPESLDLQRLLWEMKSRGVEAVVMEVTSHALALHRVDGLRFAAAAFTNLTQDHLDFHRDMEDYFIAKASLFVPERLEKGVVNIDDGYGRRLREGSRVPVLGFGTAEDAEVRATHVEGWGAGSRIDVSTPKGEAKLQSSLVGPFNVSNCLAATGICIQIGVPLEAIEAGIRALPAVAGRFEVVDSGQPFTVVVDYAHTPDSLSNVLEAARAIAAPRDGRVIVLFGCGGDRDRAKRPLMGTVAARLADVVVVTSDNPRSEDPDAIIGQILEGVAVVRAEGADVVDADRAQAIRAALAGAKPGDIVVIAGKGHETGQELRHRTIPFDDRLVAREQLAELGWDRTP